MPDYTITWSINWTADNPEDAALDVLGVVTDPESTAKVFRVDEPASGKTGLLDLEDPENPYWIEPFPTAQ